MSQLPQLRDIRDSIEIIELRYRLLIGEGTTTEAFTLLKGLSVRKRWRRQISRGGPF